MYFGLLYILFGYLLGSIPFAYIVGKVWRDIDIRKVGSKNLGTQNVYRTLGPIPGALTMFGDIGKGIAAVMLASYLGANETVIMASGIAAMAGHNWPLWLKFKGGKGFATFVGVVSILGFFHLVIMGIMYGILMALLKRKSSLSNIIAGLSLPISAFYFKEPLAFIAGFAALALLRVWIDFENWHKDFRELIYGGNIRKNVRSKKKTR